MAKLKKYTLQHNKKTTKWDLTENSSGGVLKSFTKKENATAGGVLKKLVSDEGSSVRIRKTNGQIQEERTYPRAKDPRKSKG